MARTKISEFSATPASNTDIDSINIAEGCAPSGINDAIRELMSQLKDWQAGTSNDPMVIGSSGSLTLSYGTANGVPYLNGSKVLTSGSALVFDGTNLGVNNGASLTAAGATVLYMDANQTVIRGRVTNGIIFQDSTGSEQMRLTSTGLGIGTSSPAGSLHVSKAGYAIFDNLAYAKTPGSTGLSIGYNRSGGSGESSLVWGAPASGFNFEICSYASSTITPRLTIDSSGNLGLGVTPSAWSGSKALQVRGNGAISSPTGSDALNYTAGCYYNGTNWIYTSNYFATRYFNDDGQHKWYTAPSGTAGNAITFTQAATLTANGEYLIGLTSATGVAKLQVSGALRTTGFTVSTLPAGTVGMRTYVTNALAPSFSATVVGGGAVTIPVFYNGSNWIVA